MPFTVSHAAAVAPLARWGLPVPALVIGSVAPDIFTMLPIPSLVHFAHIPAGLVTVDLAVGLVAFMLWQAFYGPALLAIAPRPLRARVSESPPSHAFGRVVLAVFLGATTHLVWDSFTHDWMWGTQHLPWLAERHGRLVGFEWVRVVSDVIGLTVVAAWFAAWWGKAPARPDTTVLPLGRRTLACLAILGPSGVVFCVLMSRDSFYVAITVASGLGVVGLTAVAWLVRRGPGRGRPGPP